GLDVIAAEKDDDVRLGLVENSAQLRHSSAGLVELLRLLVRRPRKHVRRVARADRRDYLTHDDLLQVWWSHGSGASGGSLSGATDLLPALADLLGPPAYSSSTYWTPSSASLARNP